MLGSNNVIEREQLFTLEFGLLAHRGIGEKTKERRIGVDLASFTGKTETEKPNAMVSDAETEADNQNEH